MDALFWILFVLACVALYAAFGQHRNKLLFEVTGVVLENESAFVDGNVRAGWIGLSQHIYFRKKESVGSAHVIAVLSGDKNLRIARKGACVRLVVSGKNLDELRVGGHLMTSKRAAQSNQIRPVASIH